MSGETVTVMCVKSKWKLKSGLAVKGFEIKVVEFCFGLMFKFDYVY